MMKSFKLRSAVALGSLVWMVSCRTANVQTSGADLASASAGGTSVMQFLIGTYDGHDASDPSGKTTCVVKVTNGMPQWGPGLGIAFYQPSEAYKKINFDLWFPDDHLAAKINGKSGSASLEYKGEMTYQSTVEWNQNGFTQASGTRKFTDKGPDDTLDCRDLVKRETVQGSAVTSVSALQGTWKSDCEHAVTNAVSQITFKGNTFTRKTDHFEYQGCIKDQVKRYSTYIEGTFTTPAQSSAAGVPLFIDFVVTKATLTPLDKFSIIDQHPYKTTCGLQFTKNSATDITACAKTMKFAEQKNLVKISGGTLQLGDMLDCATLEHDCVSRGNRPSDLDYLTFKKVQ